MAAGTGHWYSMFWKSALDKKVNLVTSTIDTLKIQLHTSAYVPDIDAHDFQNDLSSEVAQANNYTTGGITLASVTWSYSSGANLWILDANDVTWSSSTITARYAVVVDTTPGTSPTNPLVGYIDFGTDVQSQGGDFSITFDTAGMFKGTVS